MLDRGSNQNMSMLIKRYLKLVFVMVGIKQQRHEYGRDQKRRALTCNVR